MRHVGGASDRRRGVLGLARRWSLFALALRLAGADQQSAYMDEGTNVLTGRMLIEQHAVYAEVLNWAYGSYLWPLVAGARRRARRTAPGARRHGGVRRGDGRWRPRWRRPDWRPHGLPRERRWAWR